MFADDEQFSGWTYNTLLKWSCVAGSVGEYYTGGVRSALLKGMYVWGSGRQLFREGDGQFKAHRKLCFCSLWGVGVGCICLKTNFLVIRGKIRRFSWHTCHFDHILHGLHGPKGAAGGSEALTGSLRGAKESELLHNHNSVQLCYVCVALRCCHTITLQIR